MTVELVQGWCPTVHAPMAAADGLLSRVKPRVGGLTAAQAAWIADMAEAHGSGLIELTGRANLQLRGLTEASALAFARAMVEAGLASAAPGAERRRNIWAAPDLGPELIALAQDLEAWLESDQAPYALPAKFGFAVVPDGSSAGADIIVEGPPWRIRLDGATGVAFTDQPLLAVQALTAAFLSLSAGMSPPPRRMRGLVETISAEAVFAHAGLHPTPADAPNAPRPLIGGDGRSFGLGVAFGAADAAMLRMAAELSARFGSGWLWPTPARTLHFADVPANHHAALSAEAMKAGFIVDADDPRLRLHACVGRQGCERTRADVRGDALRLAAHWRGAGPLHLSGCAKGCAYPGPATVLLASGDGRSYNLIPHGYARSAPSRSGLTLDQAASLLQQDDPTPR